MGATQSTPPPPPLSALDLIDFGRFMSWTLSTPSPAPPSAAIVDFASNLTIERALLVILVLQQLAHLRALLRRVGLRGVYKRLAGSALAYASSAVPGVASLVASEERKALAGLEKDLLGDGDPTAVVELPARGTRVADLEKRTAALVSAEAAKATQKRWAGIYHRSGGSLAAMQGRVWSQYVDTNALYPGVFPSLRKFEAEIVAMTLSIVHGREVGACGLLASGGTEAVLLAALAYRETGRARGIEAPQILCGLSAHPAIVKACHYFGIELTKLPLDPETMSLRASAVRPHIEAGRTVAIYASAPSFAHGVIDDIEGLGALALEHGIGLHVDNCLGGFLLSFMAREGMLPTPFDFAVDGVTSMSIDVHKYGCAPKGVSVCAFRDPTLRRSTYVPCADGCEGLYVTPTLQVPATVGLAPLTSLPLLIAVGLRLSCLGRAPSPELPAGLALGCHHRRDLGNAAPHRR